MVSLIKSHAKYSAAQHTKLGTSMGGGCLGTRPGYHPQVQCGSGALGNGSGGCFHLGGYGQRVGLPVMSTGDLWVSVLIRMYVVQH